MSSFNDADANDVAISIATVKHNVLWTEVMLTIVVLLIGVLVVKMICSNNKLVAKTLEIANKTGIECVVQTNNVLGIEKLKLMK